VNDLPRRLTAILAATLLAFSGAAAAGCATDDAAEKDAEKAAEDADKAAGDKDEKAANEAEDAGRDAADEVDDNDSK